jgi:alcohol dehydrogenase
LATEKILIVTDSVISKLGLLNAHDRRTSPLGAPSLSCLMKSLPDAPIPLIEKGIAISTNEHGCDAIIAFGGGSSMDASKAIAVSISPTPSLCASSPVTSRGLRTPVKIYAVPTTAGTGSEVTVAAVISDPEKHSRSWSLWIRAWCPKWRHSTPA